MKLSIIIPLYNKEKYIERCLKSALKQDISKNEYEIIIINDGSSDSSGSIAENYAKKHTNIIYFNQENAGPSAARNKGLKASKGNYVYFLDADDYLATNILNSLLELCEQNNLEILEFNTKEIKEGAALKETSTQKSNTADLEIIDGITYVAKNGFKNEAWRYFIKNTLLKDHGIKFIEGTLYEDAIFTASLFLKASKILKANIDAHRYIVVENSIVTSKDKAHNLRFVNGMVYAVEIYHDLIKSIDLSHPNYSKAVKTLKAKQQALLFALIIRTLKHRLLSFKDLKQILVKMNKLEVYPIDAKIGGIAKSKINLLKIFNNKALLFLGIRVMRIFPSKHV